MGLGQAIAGAATGAISMLTQRKREKRSFENQKKLMNLQMRNQMELNKQGQEIQLDTWEKTNYPAQLAMIKEAGLNPSLLYGMGGTGGSTTGGQAGGSASGGSAPAPQPMELANILSAAKLKAETELLQAQKENLLADAKKKERETPDEGLISEGLRTQIREAEGRIKLQISHDELNKASTKLNESLSETQESIRKLNDSLSNLNDTKVQEAIANTEISKATLQWMQETGLHPADSQVGKVINYLSRQTGLSEENLIYIIGGAIGIRELANLIPKILLKTGKNVTVKGFGR